MDYWSGYSDIYRIAKDVVDDVLQDYLLKSQVESIDNRITTLVQTKERLMRKLERENKNETA